VWKLGSSRRALALFYSFLMVLSYVSSIGISIVDPSAAFYLFPPRAWEMLSGGLVFLHKDVFSTLSERSRKVAELTGVSLIVFSIGALDDSVVWPGWLAAIPVI